jgi:acyl carrier protein
MHKSKEGLKMTSEQIYSELSDIFSEIFFRDDIVLRHDLTADEVEGWTSFKQVEIILAVEERFDIRLHSREIDALSCVGDLANAIGEKKK